MVPEFSQRGGSWQLLFHVLLIYEVIRAMRYLAKQRISRRRTSKSLYSVKFQGVYRGCFHTPLCSWRSKGAVVFRYLLLI